MPTSAAIVSDREILAVIHCDTDEQLADIAADVKSLVERQLRHGERMTIGVGKLTRSLRCLYKSYRQAKAIMRIREKRSMLEAGYIYADMGAYRLLLGLEDREIADDYLRTLLGPLLDYDAQKGTDLVEVLRTYLFNNGSVQETAAQLYVHRNTVNYRINRAAEILGMDLGDLEARLQLMLCFLLLDMQQGLRSRRVGLAEIACVRAVSLRILPLSTNSKGPAPESLLMRGLSWNHLPVMGVCFRGFGATPGCRRVPESRRLRPWSPSHRAAGCPYGSRCTRRRSRGGPCGRSSTTSRCPRDAGSAD